MDLTLKKILLYLADRLSPGEVKELAEFLQQHPEAQSLLHRVEKHMKIRPIEAEGTLPDPQLVAAYLDGVLSRDAVADLERKTLSDELLLHELAASHFCLSTAPEGKKGSEWAQEEEIDWDRMVGLVKGGKDRPKRKPVDLPKVVGRQSKRVSQFRANRKYLLVGLGALGLLVVAVAGLVLRPRPSQRKEEVNNQFQVALDQAKGEQPGVAGNMPEATGKEASVGEAPKPMPVAVPVPMPAGFPPKPMVMPEPPIPDPPVAVVELPKVVLPVMPKADRETRKDLGRVTSQRQVLLGRKEDSTPWRRVADGGVVVSQDHLMALPGYTVELALEKGPSMTLWGNLPEASHNPMVQESEVRLLPPGTGAHGEFELLEGRVYLRGAASGQVTWRVRFRDQAWDLDLAKADDEVMVELALFAAGKSTWREGEEPVVEAVVAAIRGDVTVTANPGAKWRLSAGPGKGVFAQWNSARGMVEGPKAMGRAEPLWGRKWLGNEEGQASFRASFVELEKEMPVERIPTVGMDLALNSKGATPTLRHVALFALGCMGEYKRLLSDMGDEGQTEDRRQAATGALRHWVSEEAKRGLLLFNPQVDAGYLVDRLKLTAADANLVVDLLHSPSREEIADKENLLGVAGLLQHEQLIVRVVAKRYLEDLAENPTAGKSLVRFDCRGLPPSRRTATVAWQKLIKEGRFPAKSGPELGAPEAIDKNGGKPRVPAR